MFNYSGKNLYSLMGNIFNTNKKNVNIILRKIGVKYKYENYEFISKIAVQ